MCYEFPYDYVDVMSVFLVADILQDLWFRPSLKVAWQHALPMARQVLARPTLWVVTSKERIKIVQKEFMLWWPKMYSYTQKIPSIEILTFKYQQAFLKFMVVR